MSGKYNYKFIGWSTKDGSDKVWGVIFLEHPSNVDNSKPWWTLSTYVRYTGAKCVTFWGKRGKKFQSKVSHDDYDMQRLIDEKIKKGYLSVSDDHLNEVYPEFEKDLEKLAFWSTLKY